MTPEQIERLEALLSYHRVGKAANERRLNRALKFRDVMDCESRIASSKKQIAAHSEAVSILTETLEFLKQKGE